MFIISLTYQKPLSEVEAHLNAHIEFLKTYYEQGVFLASGRKVPRDGGIILAIAGTKDDIETILTHDPFKLHGVATYEITEFIPTMTAAELAFLTHR